MVKKKELSHWEVSRLRGKKAEVLGLVRAATEAEAIQEAMQEFQLPAWAEKRLIVRRYD